MIIKTNFNGRPALATYLDKDFVPVDDVSKAEIVEVMFTDEQNGTMFLVPSENADKKLAEQAL